MKRRKLYRVIFGCLVAAALTCLSVVAAFLVETSHPRHAKQPVLAAPVVKVILDHGHGSGVYIGAGLVLTAAHVVRRTSEEITIKTSLGAEAKAHVLWVGGENDVALLGIIDDVPIRPVAGIRCEAVPVGTKILAAGNPHDFEFVTSYGTIAGGQTEDAPEDLVVIDATVLQGMSGGPVTDTQGRLVGILSRVLLGRVESPMPFPLGAPARFGAMVPSPVLCRLLGRT